LKRLNPDHSNKSGRRPEGEIPTEADSRNEIFRYQKAQYRDGKEGRAGRIKEWKVLFWDGA
jgi:hypothetical protein